ncbi:MAG: universal stress protein [Candidatus Korobacteraceae bacterium]
MSSSAKTLLVPSLKNILFATDFSPCAQVVLPFLHDLALRYGAAIHVVHVIAPEIRTAVPMDHIPELDVDQSDAESALEAMQSGPCFSDIAHTAAVERGEVWDVLSSIVEEKKIDLIVLGTHGRRGLKKLVLGSTAEQVFRQARCPVLTIGPHITNLDMARASLAPILFATDFSTGSRHALRYAVSLARANHTSLIMLHAVLPSVAVLPGSMDAMAANLDCGAELVQNAIAAAHRQMEELISAEGLRELTPEIVIDCGEADALILNTAESKKAGLIVMGAHRASTHSVAPYMPSTASCVVREAHCPVLTVRS